MCAGEVCCCRPATTQPSAQHVTHGVNAPAEILHAWRAEVGLTGRAVLRTLTLRTSGRMHDCRSRVAFCTDDPPSEGCAGRAIGGRGCRRRRPPHAYLTVRRAGRRWKAGTHGDQHCRSRRAERSGPDDVDVDRPDSLRPRGGSRRSGTRARPRWPSTSQRADSSMAASRSSRRRPWS